MATNDPIYWPFPTSTVTEWPGTRPAGWAYHVGTDFGVAQGTPLRATISGTVYLTWNDGFGAYVLDIVRPDGFVVRNGHLSRMDVAHGSWVNAGDHIGLTGGAAGTPGAGLSTGAHLHWELRWNRNWSGPGWVDPRDLTISTFGATPAPTPTPTPTKKRKKNKMDYATVCVDTGKMVAGNKYYDAKVFCLGNGEEHNFGADAPYIDNIAKTYQTGPKSIITRSHFDKITSELAATRKRLDARK